MNLHDHDFAESVSFFHRGCAAPYIEEEAITRIEQELGLDSDLPLILTGLAWEFVTEEPLYYWSHDAAEEIHQRLSELYAEDSVKFSPGLSDAQEHLFAGINSYLSAVSVDKELSEVSYEESLKTKIFRNPLYVQLCEDCLMNIYRGLICLVQPFRMDKDYSTLDTLGRILPALKNNAFPVICEIDLDLRNAINHGNAVSKGTDVLFKCKTSGGYTVREMSVWKYQDVIDDTMDLVGGAIVGLIRFWADHPELIELMFATPDENTRFQWFSLSFRAPGTRLLFTQRSVVGSPQLTITTETSISDENCLAFVLIQILRAAHAVFPGYDRYLVAYEHPRSPIGFVRLDQKALESTSETAELLQTAIKAGEVLRFPIQQDDVDERAYRFHVFPVLSTEDWTISSVQDCSIDGHKRLKARLLLDTLHSRRTIKRFVEDAMFKICKLHTPKNPKEPVPFGEVEADIVFLDVFLRSRKRKSFSLFPNNPSFVCMSFYYSTVEVPRVTHGGIPELLWNQLEYDEQGKILIAWNPNVTRS